MGVASFLFSTGALGVLYKCLFSSITRCCSLPFDMLSLPLSDCEKPLNIQHPSDFLTDIFHHLVNPISKERLPVGKAFPRRLQAEHPQTPHPWYFMKMATLKQQ
jgi:hypothetical protein